MSVAGSLVRPFFAAAVLVAMFSLPSSAQQAPSTTTSGDSAAAPAQAQPAATPNTSSDPLKRPITEKQKKANQKALKVELGKSYKKWLDEDVRWIITDEERSAFMQLSNDEERDQFIEAFWQRRDPTPDTEENEYKEDH